MFEKPMMADGKDRKGQKKEKGSGQKIAFPKSEWPQQGKPLEELSAEELLDIVNQYQEIINDLIAKNMKPWGTDAFIAEATNKQAVYQMRRQELLKEELAEKAKVRREENE